MEEPRIRLATVDDLDAVNSIYNHYVLRSTTTYQTEPETRQQRRAWFDERSEKHPVTVAEVGGEVLGWGSLSPFRLRTAYQFTVENSIYVRHDVLRRGIGRILLADQIDRAAALGHHTILAGIDAEQTGSVALHAKYGFVEVARMREVGFKFDRWLDVIFMQRMLKTC